MTGLSVKIFTDALAQEQECYIRWDNPTENTDGTDYDDAKYTHLYCLGTDQDVSKLKYTKTWRMGPNRKRFKAGENLPVNVYFCANYAENESGVWSEMSNVVMYLLADVGACGQSTGIHG